MDARGQGSHFQGPGRQRLGHYDQGTGIVRRIQNGPGALWRAAHWTRSPPRYCRDPRGKAHYAGPLRPVCAGRAGRDVSYREIYDLVRGEGFRAGSGEQGYRANVRALIKRIRQKFRDVDPTFDLIENYPGFGYRWRDGAGA